MEEKNIRQILKRYLLGNADEKETHTVDSWYQSFDSASPMTLSEEEAAATRLEIWEKVAPVTKIERKVWVLSRPMKVAAMVILLAGAAGALYQLYSHKSRRHPTLAFNTISTGVGEKKKITLRDGSLLVLDAGTTIRVREDFSHDRKIEMVDGEVFFDVKKDDQHPFVIESGGLTTTVLGTSFNISAYKALNNISIGVVSGKLSVVSPSLQSILEKQQELVYNKNTQSYKTMALDESLTAWQEGRVVLNDLSFDEMAAITKKNFGIDLVTQDETVRNTRYTTELLTTMSPMEAAEVLAAIHNLRIQQKGNQFFLYK